LDLQEGKETTIGLWKVEKCKGTVASGDVFKAETIGWYLKPQSNEVDASGCAKGNHN